MTQEGKGEAMTACSYCNGGSEMGSLQLWLSRSPCGELLAEPVRIICVSCLIKAFDWLFSAVDIAAKKSDRAGTRRKP